MSRTQTNAKIKVQKYSDIQVSDQLYEEFNQHGIYVYENMCQYGRLETPYLFGLSRSETYDDIFLCLRFGNTEDFILNLLLDFFSPERS